MCVLVCASVVFVCFVCVWMCLLVFDVFVWAVASMLLGLLVVVVFSLFVCLFVCL